jgi:hypothetical protein
VAYLPVYLWDKQEKLDEAERVPEVNLILKGNEIDTWYVPTSYEFVSSPEMNMLYKSHRYVQPGPLTQCIQLAFIVLNS